MSKKKRQSRQDTPQPPTTGLDLDMMRYLQQQVQQGSLQQISDEQRRYMALQMAMAALGLAGFGSVLKTDAETLLTMAAAIEGWLQSGQPPRPSLGAPWDEAHWQTVPDAE